MPNDDCRDPGIFFNAERIFFWARPAASRWRQGPASDAPVYSRTKSPFCVSLAMIRSVPGKM
jgi:hypothetical protein